MNARDRNRRSDGTRGPRLGAAMPVDAAAEPSVRATPHAAPVRAARKSAELYGSVGGAAVDRLGHVAGCARQALDEHRGFFHHARNALDAVPGDPHGPDPNWRDLRLVSTLFL